MNTVLNLIQNEYSKIVGLDFVKQYLNFDLWKRF